ncbi:MAG TPA: Rieske (2Fe-2S) protein [Amycolatopsis sp.]|uniref:Rieske (2Fe-2S) protein n=1 Tax=Amycolatopsis sp. TaxID=37632 RepID=UPI002B46817C|nr:Rieske (2Fe-2S) protein [Amycolatopsis sp.]HKS46418.1 Rieske (2Fe-2S) protein [Amycolatopsis sp.]
MRTVALGQAAEIPLGEGRAYAVEGEQIVVFRLRGSGELRAMQALCPHRGGPLADGQIDQDLVVCPLHANMFSLTDGSCVTADYHVEVYPAWEHDGQVMISLA